MAWSECGRVCRDVKGIIERQLANCLPQSHTGGVTRDRPQPRTYCGGIPHIANPPQRDQAGVLNGIVRVGAKPEHTRATTPHLTLVPGEQQAQRRRITGL
jgi:hypothetical protein